MKKSVALSAALLIILTLPSCERDNWSQVWKQGGVLADSYISIYAPNWPHRDAFHDAWNRAHELIEDWKKGTPCSNVLQAITSAVDLLAQIPVSGTQQTNLMAAIVATANSVTAVFDQCSPNPRGIGPPFDPAVTEKAKTLKPPTTAKEVNALWESQGGKVPK